MAHGDTTTHQKPATAAPVRVDPSSPAFPFTERAADGSHWHSHAGLPVRLELAARFMAPLVPGETGTFDQDAKSALMAADALLRAYNSGAQL